MTSRPGVAALQMYDLPEIRGAVDELWRRIATELDADPPELTWDGDPVAVWQAPDLVLAQTCGWPLVTSLAGRVTVVGAFDYRLGDDNGAATYRSVLVARADRPLAELAGGVAAVNEADSLSGRVSLAVAVAPHAGERPFFESVIETGSHLASLEAVRDGHADLASIDAVTHALLARERPAAVAGLHVVGRGPAVPTLPLVTAATDPEPLRVAIGAAMADPATASCRDRLLIEGFVPVDASVYDGLLAFEPVADRILPPPNGDV